MVEPLLIDLSQARELHLQTQLILNPSQALEPLLIDLSQTRPGTASGDGYEYSEAAAISCAEALKGVVCLLLVARDPRRQHGQLVDFTYEKIRPFIIPAVLLAIANQTLFVGITYLGALLNQIARKAVCILATALLAQALLGQQLSYAQRFSLVMLTGGFILLLPRVSALGEVDPAALLSPGAPCSPVFAFPIPTH